MFASQKEQYDIRTRTDRIGKYFRKYLNRFVFAEFSEECAKKSKAGDLMRGIPIPLREEEVKDFAGGSGISMSVIAENMAWVMGCDPHFRRTGDYAAILSALFGSGISEAMLKTGRDAAEKGDMDNACIHFRAALCVNRATSMRCTAMRGPAERSILPETVKSTWDASRLRRWNGSKCSQKCIRSSLRVIII